MKIELELPDWCEERNIYIMAGIELAAYRDADGKWHVKTGRCNMCGQCCTNFKVVYRKTFPPIVNLHCLYLERIGNDFRCALGINRPFKCSVAPVPKHIPDCTERFEQI